MQEEVDPLELLLEEAEGGQVGLQELWVEVEEFLLPDLVEGEDSFQDNQDHLLTHQDLHHRTLNFHLVESHRKMNKNSHLNSSLSQLNRKNNKMISLMRDRKKLKSLRPMMKYHMKRQRLKRRLKRGLKRRLKRRLKKNPMLMKIKTLQEDLQHPIEDKEVQQVEEVEDRGGLVCQ